MSRKTKQKIDYGRSAIANEAARIIQEQGLTDFRAAKDKARERLGYRSARPLPSNEEIERALAERNRIFRGDTHWEYLQNVRRSAAAVMRSLHHFYPRLVGSVLSGIATEHSAIDLHLFSDPAEAVTASLDALGIRHRSTQFGYRFQRGKTERFPGYRFVIEDCEFCATVFPELRRRHAPFSPVDGKPMQRATLKDLERLIAAPAGPGT